MSVAMLMLTCQLLAQEFTTPGDGKVYSFQSLSAISESGVTFSDGAYIVNGIVTIATGDEFVIDSGATVCFTNEGELVIKGKADLRANTPTHLGPFGETTTSLGLNVESEELVSVCNLTFDQVGLRGGVKAGIDVSDCTFLNHNGSASSALFLGGDGATFNVVNVHHITYENLGEEKDEDLTVLCQKCHAGLHDGNYTFFDDLCAAWERLFEVWENETDETKKNIAKIQLNILEKAMDLIPYASDIYEKIKSKKGGK